MKVGSHKEDTSQSLSAVSYTKIMFQETSEFSSLLPLEKKRHGQLYRIFQISYRINIKPKDFVQKFSSEVLCKTGMLYFSYLAKITKSKFYRVLTYYYGILFIQD